MVSEGILGILYIVERERERAMVLLLYGGREGQTI